MTPAVTITIPQDSVKERQREGGREHRSETESLVVFLPFLIFLLFPIPFFFYFKEMQTEKYKSNRQGRQGRVCLYSMSTPKNVPGYLKMCSESGFVDRTLIVA